MAQIPTDYDHIVSKTFISLKNKLSELISEGVLQTVERYNGQLDNEKGEDDVLLPAAYIEIISVLWESGNWEVRQGEVFFAIHVCVETEKNFDIEDWEVNQKIHSKIQGFQAADIHGAFLSVDDDINHNYNVVIDNILKYRTFVNDESLLKNRIKDSISTITVNQTVSET